MTPLTLTLALLFPPGPAPEDIRAALALFRSDCWHCREDGSRRLERAVRRDRSQLGRLLAAMGSRDPETAWRAFRVVRTLYPCPHCHGTGWNRTGDWDWELQRIVYASCWSCRGSRTGLYRMARRAE